TPRWSRRPAAPGCSGSTPSCSRSSGWRCPWPSGPAGNSAAARTTTGNCLTRCPAAAIRPARRCGRTWTAAPPSCTASGSSSAGAGRTDPMAANGWDVIVSPWHLDEHLPAFPVPAGAAATVVPPLPAGSRPARMKRLFEALADAIAAADRPLLLSGDCTAALGTAAGLQRRAGNLAVTWLDAHGDFNTPETTISGYLGGMALALLTGRAPELIGPPGLRPVAED